MSTKKPIILIADDDPEILTMLGIRLSKKGYQVLEAVDGNQTLNLAHKHHPDLVLLDVMMPGKNGWEVAKELRANHEFSNVGIVMLTAIGEKVNEMTSPLYGADAYVDKPFDFSDLEKKIKDVLAERAQALVVAATATKHKSSHSPFTPASPPKLQPLCAMVMPGASPLPPPLVSPLLPSPASSPPLVPPSTSVPLLPPSGPPVVAV